MSLPTVRFSTHDLGCVRKQRLSAKRRLQVQVERIAPVSDLDEIRILQPTFPNYLDPSVFLATNRNLRTRRSAQLSG